MSSLILPFKNSSDFRKWLTLHHSGKEEIWIRFYKKASGVPTITYAEALDEALCFGWIDGQVRKYDANSWIQRFTPRRPKSLWSKRNTQHAERLIQSRKMRPAGLKAIKAAQADGRWKAAYDAPSQAKPPQKFLTALKKNPKAFAFFKTLNRSNIFAIVYRLQTAKRPETLARRIFEICKMLEKGQAFFPQKSSVTKRRSLRKPKRPNQ